MSGWLAVLLAASAAAAPAHAVVALEHIPVAVNDLGRAADTYRKLGFSLKPGRYHEDGIRNQHVKFIDGAGIELITADAARDSLSAHYVTLLKSGDGPAYVSFRTASLDALGDLLFAGGSAFARDGNLMTLSEADVDYLFFFEGDNRSATDRAEHFDHPNSAFATAGVWIAGGDAQRMAQVLASLGAAVASTRVYAPDKINATVATVGMGEVIFLPTSRQLIPGRPVIGVVIEVRSLECVRPFLASQAPSAAREIKTAVYQSLIVAPRDAHGMWLEFREERHGGAPTAGRCSKRQ